MMVASMPMYDLPEIAGATDSWWKGLARAFRRAGIPHVAERLLRCEDHGSLWTRPDLLISQTCGFPLTHELRDKVTLVATPCYSAPGCDGPNYRSCVVVRREFSADQVSALKGAKCAVNSYESQSGFNALRALIAPLSQGGPFFQSVVLSGGHLNSLRMVCDGEADVAAIDCVTYTLLARHRPGAIECVRLLCHTPAAPGLPYITHRAADQDLLHRLRAGLEAACRDPELRDARELLMIRDICVLPISAYERIPAMAADAAAFGCREFT